MALKKSYRRHHVKSSLLALLLTLSACGFSPLYGPHEEQTASVAEAMNKIDIANIKDHYGQVLRNHLIDRLYVKGRPQAPSTQLTVTINAQETDLGIQKDATASRRELSLWAPYTLSSKEGNPLMNGSAHSVVSYSQLDAQYGTVTGQRNAYNRALKEVSEQIVNRLALYFAESQYRTPKPDYPSFLLPSK